MFTEGLKGVGYLKIWRCSWKIQFLGNTRLKTLAITGSFISLMKRNISHNCGNFLQNRTTIAPPPPRSNLLPPCYLWFVKCLIPRVRNLKCIFLKSLLFYRLTWRQHFYFARFLSRISETWAHQCEDQWCRDVINQKNRNILTSVTRHEMICPLGVVKNQVISK